jgi:hypothetical protein
VSAGPQGSERTSEVPLWVRFGHFKLRHYLLLWFQEIVAYLAVQLGYGGIALLDNETRQKLEDEADDLLDQWEEEVEMADGPPPEPKMPLQHLLRDHHKIAECILDIRDDAIARDFEDDDDFEDDEDKG